MSSAFFDLINTDPPTGYIYNNKQKKFFDAIKEPKLGTITIVLLLKGNRAGGSWALVTAWEALMWGSNNPSFQGSPYGKLWPFTKSARLAAPMGSLGDRGPIQQAMSRLFPFNSYTQNKGAGKGYYVEGHTNSDWTWDVVTYDQPSIQAAGANKGLILMTEPPPQNMFTECITRLSGNGMLIAEFTRLDMADFIDDYVDEGALKNEKGEVVGEVRVVEADIHDACEEHSNGHMKHSAIESMIAAWPVDEREARKTGRALSRSGRIYTRWGDQNELEALPQYHQDCWDRKKFNLVQVQDPHDRKPWAIGWFAVFPNNDKILIAEWPEFSFKDTPTSPVFDVEEYRDIIHVSEKEIGFISDVRIEDPNFSKTPNKGAYGKSIKDSLAGACRKCLREDETRVTCPHSLVYVDPPDSIAEGHMLVRAAIGDETKGLRPKLYALKDCFNFCHGMRHYAYKENREGTKRGPSETPELVHSDFPTLARYLETSGYGEYQKPSEPYEPPKQSWGRRKNQILNAR